MKTLSILVVDDDALARKVMASRLSSHKAELVGDAAAAKRKLAKGGYDLCFLDLDLGAGGSGLDLIPLAAEKKIYSVVMSGHDSEPMVEKAYELGCDDFYAKGESEGGVEAALERFARREGPTRAQPLPGDFTTQDPETRAAVEEALKFAPSDIPILILGPSGSGKTNLARVIHEHSGRSGPFVAINCAAQTEDLLEAELFGYRKGAFTGAGDGRKGKLLLADGGTLFLDEVGSMSLEMQAKLLKAIEERSFFPLGSDKSETSRFRIVSATLEDVQALVKSGRLRFDFFQRIHGLTVELKPLRERACDVLPLVNAFTRGGRRLAFAPDAKEALLAHPWPGNARELKRFVELLAAGGEGRVTGEQVKRLLKSSRADAPAAAEPMDMDGHYRFALGRGLDAAVDRFVDALIARNLKENEGKKVKVLADLKISTRILYASLRRGGPSEEGR